MEKTLPPIPAKRYFTIGEVSDLCAVKPYVLRYWEQEFTQLKPMKRRGNRRYYQHHEVLLIRRIRELLYDHGFTISGARNRLADGVPGRLSDAGLSDAELGAELGVERQADDGDAPDLEAAADALEASAPANHRLTLPERAVAATAVHAGSPIAAGHAAAAVAGAASTSVAASSGAPGLPLAAWAGGQLRAELMSIRELLSA